MCIRDRSYDEAYLLRQCFTISITTSKTVTQTQTKPICLSNVDSFFSFMVSDRFSSRVLEVVSLSAFTSVLSLVAVSFLSLIHIWADIIIGVDVQNDLKPANELNSTGSILGQLINLMGLELYKKNLKETDTYIKVDVEGYSAASFTPSAVDTLIRRGEEAALAQKNSLIKLKQELGLDSTYMPVSYTHLDVYKRQVWW